jgi:glycosyltransferase involved in cell wall biosynthesis
MIRLGIVRDFAEEGWPSMDLCAEMLLAHVESRDFELVDLRPAYQRFPGGGRGGERSSGGLIRRLERVWNRMRVYPRALSEFAGSLDAMHVVDHSYAHLLLDHPARVGGAYCHDLDTFRCLLEPDRERRSRAFRAMTKRILRGLQYAKVVFHSTDAVRDEILRFDLIDPARLVKAPPGVCDEFVSDRGTHDNEVIARLRGRRCVLHVGSCIPRKGIETALRSFAEAVRAHPELLLVKIGGQFTRQQTELIDALGLGQRLLHLAMVPRAQLAAWYRSAELLLVPSLREGFGMPVIEALRCGCRVLASDIPALREAGGSGTRFAPAGDEEAWSSALIEMLRSDDSPVERAARIAHASRFSWAGYASTIFQSYRRALGVSS